MSGDSNENLGYAEWDRKGGDTYGNDDGLADSAPCLTSWSRVHVVVYDPHGVCRAHVCARKVGNHGDTIVVAQDSLFKGHLSPVI